MRLCRYDDDRLGVVRGSMVHDVTEAQTQIRAAAPYAMKGDAVIAALPAWRARLEEMAARKRRANRSPQVKLLSPGRATLEARGGAYQLQGPYRGNGGARRHARTSSRRLPSAPPGFSSRRTPPSSARPKGSQSVSPSGATSTRSSSRSFSAKQAAIFRARRRSTHVAGYCIGLDMTARGPEDRSFRKSIDSIFRARTLDGHRR